LVAFCWQAGRLNAAAVAAEIMIHGDECFIGFLRLASGIRNTATAAGSR
jgi:hypothetical protein